MPQRRSQFADRRRTVGLNQEQLAELLQVDRSTIGRWEAGKTMPQPWKRQALADALRVSLEALDEMLAEATEPSAPVSADIAFELPSIGNTHDDAPDDGATASPHAPSSIAQVPAQGARHPVRADGSAAALYSGEAADESDEDPMIRRTFLLSAAALAGMSAADKAAALEAVRRSLHSSLAAERAEADAGEWQQIAQDYGESYRTAAPAELLGPLMTDLLGLQATMRRYAAHQPVQRELLATAALLSAFAAQTMSNMGQLLEAKRWWRTAKRAADRSGDPYSIVWVRGREICHAMGQQPTRDVLNLIAAAEAIPVQASTAHLEITSMKAQTLALGGWQQESVAALNEVKEEFTKSPSGYSTSLLSWGYERLLHTESFTYAHLGQFGETERATNEGVRLYADHASGNVRSPAALQLNVAYALVRNGDVSEGLHHAQRVIASLPEAHRGPAITDGQKLTSIVPAAAQHQADVRQYQEWINGIEVPTAEG